MILLQPETSQIVQLCAYIYDLLERLEQISAQVEFHYFRADVSNPSVFRFGLDNAHSINQHNLQFM